MPVILNKINLFSFQSQFMEFRLNEDFIKNMAIVGHLFFIYRIVFVWIKKMPIQAKQSVACVKISIL